MNNGPVVLVRAVAASAVNAFAAPAHADMTALYETTLAPMPMTVEVNDAGDVRVQQSTGASYYLMTGGKAYIVQRGPNGPYAAEMGLYLQIQAEQFSDFAASIMKGIEGAADIPTPEFTSLGPTEIRGRVGTGYSFSFASNAKPEAEAKRRPMFVVSDDPQLAPLGEALARFQRTGGQAMGRLLPMFQSFSDGTAEVIGTGAPLRMGPSELTQVDMAAIDPARFALPAEPLTEGQIREMFQPFAPPHAFPDWGSPSRSKGTPN